MVDKQWWAPVWKGLVMDPKAKHYRGMRNAVWLFLYLLLNANRRTGFLVRKVETIGADMGIARDTVFRWLRMLREGGYVTTENTGRCLRIQITRWKPLAGAGTTARQGSEECHPSSGRAPTSLGGPNREAARTTVSCEQGFEGPNDSPMKRIVLKNDIDGEDTFEHPSSPSPEIVPNTREELLAVDLAEGLDDHRGLALYLSFAKRYPEALLRRLMSLVRDVPARKIKKSRGALYNHLVQKHDQTSHHSGH